MSARLPHPPQWHLRSRSETASRPTSRHRFCLFLLVFLHHSGLSRRESVAKDHHKRTPVKPDPQYQGGPEPLPDPPFYHDLETRFLYGHGRTRSQRDGYFLPHSHRLRVETETPSRCLWGVPTKDPFRSPGRQVSSVDRRSPEASVIRVGEHRSDPGDGQVTGARGQCPFRPESGLWEDTEEHRLNGAPIASVRSERVKFRVESVIDNWNPFSGWERPGRRTRQTHTAESPYGRIRRHHTPVDHLVPWANRVTTRVSGSTTRATHTGDNNNNYNNESSTRTLIFPTVTITTSTSGPGLR